MDRGSDIRTGVAAIRAKKLDKRLTETQIADRLSREPEFGEYKGRPEQIRQRLPEARKIYKEHLKQERMDEIYDGAMAAYDPADDDWFHDEYS